MKKDNLRILGIESSCDETAASVVESGRLVHSSVIASQIDLHAQYGGVYPELASREHVKAIYAVTNEALQQAHMQIRDLDAIAVTRGPGLAGSLVVGVNFAKGLAVGSNLPLYPISHLEGHIYAAWCSPADTKPGPAQISTGCVAGIGRPHRALTHDRSLAISTAWFHRG